MVHSPELLLDVPAALGDAALPSHPHQAPVVHTSAIVRLHCLPQLSLELGAPSPQLSLRHSFDLLLN